MKKSINKHLTLEQRIQLEKYLNDWNNELLSFTIIGKDLHKDPTSISKEIKRNLIIKKPSSFNNGFNQCSHKYDCKKRHLCNEYCKLKCSECEYCNNYCPDFEKALCTNLKKPPYVCNWCPSYNKCKLEKHFYNAVEAHKKYSYTLSDSRAGININISQFKKYEDALREGLDKGLSFEAVILTSPEIPFSVRTAYRHLEKNVFSKIGAIDLRNKVKMPVKLKSRKKSPEEIAAFRIAKKGRNYEDFEKFFSKNQEISIVEMDTVIGKQTEPSCLLTFYIRKACLLLAFKLEEHTAEAVVNEINQIEQIIGQYQFKKIFNVILTDNRTEFSDVKGIEYSPNNKKRCKLFFCDPMASCQKGRIENAHRLIRYVYPKSTSFSLAIQDDITLMCNHINNYPRRNLKGYTPYDLAKTFLSKKVLNALEIVKIETKDILLKPELVNKTK